MAKSGDENQLITGQRWWKAQVEKYSEGVKTRNTAVAVVHLALQ